MIDKVFILNLERRADKWWFMLGALRALNFPFDGTCQPWGDTIVRFTACDGADCPDCDSVTAAILNDGFPGFVPPEGENKFYLAWIWTWLKALSEIASMSPDQVVLLLIDDFILELGWDWNRLLKLIYECRFYESEHGKFRILQLYSWKDGSIVRPACEIGTSMLRRGLGGYADFGTILTPAGAQLLLDEHFSKSYFYPDGIFGSIAKSGLTDGSRFEGLWHTIDSVVRGGYSKWKSDLRG